MKPLPLVSVIITCYNIRDFIGDALLSVQNQTYVNIEIIVVDDGSTDGTHEKLHALSLNGNVTCLRKENGGPSSARNWGVDRAKGELIAFLDGDDLWEADKLERQVASLLAHPQAGMIFSDFSTFDTDGIVVTCKNKSMFTNLEPVSHAYLVSRNNFIYPSTVVMRKSIVEQYGGFDESLRGPEDWDLWLRVVRHSTVIGLHTPLVKIRQHANNISANVSVMLENERRAVEKQRPYLGRMAYRKRLARLYLLNADRSIHNGNRWQALNLFYKGIIIYPFHVVTVCIVLAKFLVGGKLSNSLRRTIDVNSWLRQCFELVYKKY